MVISAGVVLVIGNAVSATGMDRESASLEIDDPERTCESFLSDSQLRVLADRAAVLSTGVEMTLPDGSVVAGISCAWGDQARFEAAVLDHDGIRLQQDAIADVSGDLYPELDWYAELAPADPYPEPESWYARDSVITHVLPGAGSGLSPGAADAALDVEALWPELVSSTREPRAVAAIEPPLACVDLLGEASSNLLEVGYVASTYDAWFSEFGGEESEYTLARLFRDMADLGGASCILYVPYSEVALYYGYSPVSDVTAAGYRASLVAHGWSESATSTGIRLSRDSGYDWVDNHHQNYLFEDGAWYYSDLTLDVLVLRDIVEAAAPAVSPSPSPTPTPSVTPSPSPSATAVPADEGEGPDWLLIGLGSAAGVLVLVSAIAVIRLMRGGRDGSRPSGEGSL